MTRSLLAMADNAVVPPVRLPSRKTQAREMVARHLPDPTGSQVAHTVTRSVPSSPPLSLNYGIWAILLLAPEMNLRPNSPFPIFA